MADDTRPSFPHSVVSAGTGDLTSVAKGPTRVTSISVSNINANECYLKLYDSAAAPTAGSGTPVYRILIPGSVNGGIRDIPLPQGGLGFVKGIAYALIVEAADSGTTGVTAAEVLVNLGWQRVNG